MTAPLPEPSVARPNTTERTILPVPDIDEVDLTIWDADLAVKRAARRELRDDVMKQGRSPLSALSLAIALFLIFDLALLRIEGRNSLPLIIALVVSGLWFGVTRLPTLGTNAQRDLGHVFYLSLCGLLAGARHSGVESLDLFTVPLSTLLVVAYAALVPASPRSAAALAFGGAAADPMALMLVRGSLVDIPYAFASVTLTGFTALGLSRVIHHLHEGIEKARSIGGYKLIAPLGSGGMAEVWRASHRMLQRPAAIKLIRPEALIRHGEQGAERLLRIFLREARATSQLSSPHTISLFDFGITREGSFYYVMELLDGVDLKRLVEKCGPLPPERVAHLLAQIARSLEEAHARNFVHRDLKPANVFACRMGEQDDYAKVLDFGLVLDRHPTAEEIEDETFVGTPSVMAPEMIRFQSKVDARADIYSLGCVGYWLATGHNVFEAKTRADMLVMHAHQRPSSPSKRLGRTLHGPLEQLLMDCLEKNPDKRPTSAAEVRRRLREMQFETPWTEERAAEFWRAARITL